MTWPELLARHASCDDFPALFGLCREARRLGPPPGAPLRLALLGEASTDLCAEPLWLALAAAGLSAELCVAPFGRVAEELVDPASKTSAFRPHVVLALLVPHGRAERLAPGATAAEAAAEAERACRELLEPCALLHARCGAEIVLNTLPALPRRPLGNLAARLPEDANNFLRRFNLALGDLAPAYVHVHDVAALAERRGLERWLDERRWFEARQAIAPECIPEYARDAAALVAALHGRTRKVLAVDLDDTLWGGVVGEVGVGGLELGEGSPRGEVYKDLQRYLKRLAGRGVLLAVCSKNEEGAALAPFEQHPECVLARRDFSAFRANWAPKSENLRAIAAELDLGLDAFVFLDDNPAEREEVRRALPEVAVPEPADDDPLSLVQALERGRWFEPGRLTEEDRRRGELYRRAAGARSLKAGSTDLTGYLRALAMTARLGPFDPVSLDRITQLVNKTNQLNLTGARVTRAEVEAMAADPARVTLCARLADRFGDHGLVAAAYARVRDGALDIDGWVMSCRVLGRGLNRALLNAFADAARRRNLAALRGTFVPTGRNEPSRDHYAKLGFAPAPAPAPDGAWTLDLSAFEPLDHQIAAR